MPNFSHREFYNSNVDLLPIFGGLIAKNEQLAPWRAPEKKPQTSQHYGTEGFKEDLN